jgi:hypothetical protein
MIVDCYSATSPKHGGLGPDSQPAQHDRLGVVWMPCSFILVARAWARTTQPLVSGRSGSAPLYSPQCVDRTSGMPREDRPLGWSWTYARCLARARLGRQTVRSQRQWTLFARGCGTENFRRVEETLPPEGFIGQRSSLPLLKHRNRGGDHSPIFGVEN